MTTEEVANHIDNVLPEFVDCYLLIGQTVGGEPLVRARVPDGASAERINTILYAILTQGGVPHG